MQTLAGMTVRQVREWTERVELTPTEVVAILLADHRQGVRHLADRVQQQWQREREEHERLERALQFERALWRQGFTHVAGVDEAGCGPLAGPVVTAAVIWPQELLLPGLNDSKQMTAMERDRLYDLILERSAGVGVAVIDSATIDEINIRQADLLGMEQALQGLPKRPDYVLTDAWKIPGWSGHQLAVIDGDAHCLSIAAASVIAKVTRDRLMLQYDQQFPQYGFAQHKGYPTPAHLQALREYGLTPIHRRSFLKHLGGDRS